MEKFTKLLDLNASNSCIQKSIEFIRKDVIDDVNNTVYINDSIITSDIIQKYIFCNHSEFHDKIFQPIVLDACMHAESLSGGSGEMTLFLIAEMLKKLSPKIHCGESPSAVSRLLKSAQNTSVKRILDTGHRATVHSTEQLLVQSINNSTHREIVEIALELAGKNRKILVKKSNHKETRVSLTKGCRFNIKASSEFLNDKMEWARTNVKCIIIDGTIIEVSEIHHLLEIASETRQPYIILARSFSQDVINTLLVNKMRGVLDVIPVNAEIDEDTINILSDIATVCGCDVVSSLKGELISSAVKETLPIVDRVKITALGIEIENRKTVDNVSQHVSMIEKKKKECGSNDLYDLLDKRTTALLGGNVSICVGTELLTKEPRAIEEIDRFLRQFFSHIGFGYITVDEIKGLNIPDDIISDELVLFMNKKFKEGIVPLSSIISAIRISTSVVKNMLSIGSILVRDV